MINKLGAIQNLFDGGKRVGLSVTECDTGKEEVAVLLRHAPNLEVGQIDQFLANVNVTFTFAICYRPSVCRLSVVCDVGAPYSGGRTFRQFFNHTIAQGLYFSGAKNRWWGTPLSP